MTRKYNHLIPAAFLLLLLTLTACSVQDRSPISGHAQNAQLQSKGSTETPFQEKSLPPKPSVFGSVPWFRDDTGSSTQMAAGWIYGYWGRQLCRINIHTLEAEVLYEAVSFQDGCFCIRDESIYFLEKREVDYLDGAKSSLLRMKCDGSDRLLLAEDISVREHSDYRMNFYEDILYLTDSYGTVEENLFFRITKDGTAEAVHISETLYGLLPDGCSDACQTNKYRALPNLASCMTHFGYAFVTDDECRLYRIIPESGEMEEFPLADPASSGYFFLTNEALVYMQDKDIWYAASLDNPETVTEIGELACNGINFWDKEGMYYVNRRYDEDSFRLERLNWNGTSDRVLYDIRRPMSSLSADSLDFFYYDGTYLYYNRLHQGDSAVYRIRLKKDSDCLPELVYVYYDNPIHDISVSETFDTTFTANESGVHGCFSMTKVSMTEQTAAAARINQFLENLYEAENSHMEELKEIVRNAASSEWPEAEWNSGTIVEYSAHFSVNYIDDNYIGLGEYWYVYWQGAAHGMHGAVEYVFSRATGEQLQITDVVKNTESEIKAIIGPYVEARAEWGTAGEDWEAILLQEGRFFLTPEGIGIHFDAYEMTCYASGGLDVIVPYEKFEMAQPR